MNISKVRPMTTTTKDKESLYEENFQLKSYINTLKKDFTFSKSENQKLELEVNKQEKIIEDMAVEGDKFSKAKEVKMNFKYLFVNLLTHSTTIIPNSLTT